MRLRPVELVDEPHGTRVKGGGEGEDNREEDQRVVVRANLPRRSLYIMRGAARYNFTHEISGTLEELEEAGDLLPAPSPRPRRLSLMFRNELRQS